MSIIKTIKKQIIRIANKFGYDIVYYQPHYRQYQAANFDNIYQDIFRHLESPIIFDVGSHRGESIDRFTTILDKPTIYAFEPEKDNYKALKQYDANNIILNNCGVGNTSETLELHSYWKTDTSSFNKIDANHPWTISRAHQAKVSRDKKKPLMKCL